MDLYNARSIKSKKGLPFPRKPMSIIPIMCLSSTGWAATQQHSWQWRAKGRYGGNTLWDAVKVFHVHTVCGWGWGSSSTADVSLCILCDSKHTEDNNFGGRWLLNFCFGNTFQPLSICGNVKALTLTKTHQPFSMSNSCNK